MPRSRSIDDLLDADNSSGVPPAQNRPETAAESVTASPASGQPPAAKTTRTTLDLRQDEFEAFVDWCAATAKQVGKPRVHGQQVMRVLVRRLLTDQRLAGQVTSDLRKNAGQLSSRY